MATIKVKVDNEYASAAQFWVDAGGMGLYPLVQTIMANASNAENPGAVHAKFRGALTALVADYVAKSAYDAQLNTWRVAKLAKGAPKTVDPRDRLYNKAGAFIGTDAEWEGEVAHFKALGIVVPQ
jgi:hypothetical protein